MRMSMGNAFADNGAPGSEPRAMQLDVSALRRAIPVRMWGGNGCGVLCDFCRVPVTPYDIEYEVEARLDDSMVLLHFHTRCHESWREGQEAGSFEACAQP